MRSCVYVKCEEEERKDRASETVDIGGDEVRNVEGSPSALGLIRMEDLGVLIEFERGLQLLLFLDVALHFINMISHRFCCNSVLMFLPVFFYFGGMSCRSKAHTGI